MMSAAPHVMAARFGDIGGLGGAEADVLTDARLPHSKRASVEISFSFFLGVLLRHLGPS